MLLLFLAPPLSVFTQFPPSDANYEEILVDDFTGTTLNDGIWDKKAPWNQCCNTTDFSNCEEGTQVEVAYRRWQDDNNVKVSDGTLKLITNKEFYIGEVWSWPEPDYELVKDFLPFNYTTGMLYSRSQFRYGYFEIKFKLPPPPPDPKTYKGLGPNFWMYENEPFINKWSEIDVFEINSENNLFTTNAHYQETDSSNHYSETKEHGNLDVEVWYIASVNWTPSNIEFYLDGVRIREYPNSPDKLIPMPIIVDINSPATNFCNELDPINTHFPYVYEVDWIKAYGLKMDCSTFLIACDVDFSLMNYSVKRKIHIGGSGCSNIIENGEKITLRSIEGVTIQGEFTVQSGATFSIVPTECECR